ncbi:ArpU family phage packaging/lysis transcriptional regulator [Streptococcus sp. NLN64]|uniref:ArpU family phage packaging/lysis transcriptional regulator n=1 Tax=Streptococcus sp. NLN64 TaxID=2822799 RepID=UPI0018CB17DC|nr:ArpU family phage packaging/lysis transcriptional regulator [Streptococcus sp. NLN64]MBG9366539.1 ArpU family transcriptional regulator [Streptococcus sp. NLN64]
MAFFPEIDEEKTIANAKRKLKEYPRWKRIAGEPGTQKVTQVFTFDLRNPGGSPNRAVEKLAINRVDAEAELDAIEYAISNLHVPTYRRILYERYLNHKPLSDVRIYDNLFLSESQYYEFKRAALLAFAELYREGSLIVHGF